MKNIAYCFIRVIVSIWLIQGFLVPLQSAAQNDPGELLIVATD